MIKTNKLFTYPTLVLFITFQLVACAAESDGLQLEIYTGQFSGIGENSFTLIGENEAIQIDSPWLLGDGEILAEKL